MRSKTVKWIPLCGYSFRCTTEKKTRKINLHSFMQLVFSDDVYFLCPILCEFSTYFDCVILRIRSFFIANKNLTKIHNSFRELTKKDEQQEKKTSHRIIFIRCVRKCDSFKFTSCLRDSSLSLKYTKIISCLALHKHTRTNGQKTKVDTVAEWAQTGDTIKKETLRALRSY